MENSVQDQLLKFSAELPPIETHNQTRCVSSTQPMREELRSLTMTNPSCWGSNNSNNNTSNGDPNNRANKTANMKQPPRLEMISSHSTQSTTTAAVSTNENANVTTAFLNPAPNAGYMSGTQNIGPSGGTVVPPKLIPISSSLDSAAVGVNIGNVSNQLKEFSFQDIASNRKPAPTFTPLIRSVSLNTSNHHHHHHQQQNQLLKGTSTHRSPGSDESGANHTTSSCARQDSSGGSRCYDSPSDLITNCYGNNFRDCNSQQPSFNTPNTPNKTTKTESTPVSKFYNSTNDSRGFPQIGTGGINADGFGYEVYDVESIFSGNTAIDANTYKTSAIGANSNFNLNNSFHNNSNLSGTGSLNNSAVFGDDSFLGATAGAPSNELFFGGVSSYDQSNAATITSNNNDVYGFVQNDFLDMMSSLNPNDPDGIFGSGSLINKHFFEYPGQDMSRCTSYVIAKPPGTASGNDAIVNVPPTNNSNNVNTHQLTTLSMDHMGGSTGVNPIAGGSRQLPSSSRFEIPSNNGNPSLVRGYTVPSYGGCGKPGRLNNSTGSYHRKPSSGRRRLDASDPAASQKRQNHNMLERRRRSELRGSFVSLVSLIPELRGIAANRLSKVKILASATNHIRNIIATKENHRRLFEDRHRLICAIKEKIGLIAHSVVQTTSNNDDNSTQQK